MSTSNRGGSQSLSTLGIALRVIWGHRVYLAIYLVALSFMAVFVAMGSAPDYSQEQAVSVRPQVAVIDRDHSAVSQGVAAFMAERGELVELEDTERALQDAAAEDRVVYTLIIPNGYGADLMESAAAGREAPALQTVVSYSGASGFLMDVQVLGYLQAIYGFAGTLGSSQEEAVALATEATVQDAQAGIARTADGPPAARFYVYLTFSTYPLFASITVCIALLMKALNDRDLRRRTLVAPTRSVSRSAQILLACVVLGLVAWVWVMALGTACFGLSILREDPLRLGSAAVTLLAYALFSVSVGFLLGQLGAREQAANMIANVGGLVLSFLGGAWVSMSMLPHAVVAVARFTPAYWMIEGMNELLVRQGGLVGGMVDAGITALFALAVGVVALAVGRARVREE